MYNLVGFKAGPGRLEGSPLHIGYTGGMRLGFIGVLGCSASPVKMVKINNKPLPFIYNTTLKVNTFSPLHFTFHNYG